MILITIVTVAIFQPYRISTAISLYAACSTLCRVAYVDKSKLVLYTPYETSLHTDHSQTDHYSPNYIHKLTNKKVTKYWSKFLKETRIVKNTKNLMIFIVTLDTK
jgi:hypothetical protein